MFDHINKYFKNRIKEIQKEVSEAKLPASNATSSSSLMNSSAYKSTAISAYIKSSTSASESAKSKANSLAKNSELKRETNAKNIDNCKDLGFFTGKWGTASWSLTLPNGDFSINDGVLGFKPLHSIMLLNSAQKIKSINFFNVTANKDCNYLFSNLPNITKIDLTGLKTNDTQTIKGLFKNDKSLQVLKLDNLDTRRITDMSDMFLGTNNIKTLRLGKYTYLDNTVKGNINNSVWFSANNGQPETINNFKRKSPETYIYSHKYKDHKFTSQIIGNYLLNHDKSLSNYITKYTNLTDYNNPILRTKLADLCIKIAVYNKFYNDMNKYHIFYKYFKEWCSHKNISMNNKNYERWRLSVDSFVAYAAYNQETSTPQSILKLINNHKLSMNLIYNHTTKDETKLLNYLTKHNISAKDVLMNIKNSSVKYKTTHNSKLINKLSALHQYFSTLNTHVKEILDDNNIPYNSNNIPLAITKLSNNPKLIKLYNKHYHEHRFIGESRHYLHKDYYEYDELAKAIKQNVVPDNMMTSQSLNNLYRYTNKQINITQNSNINQDTRNKLSTILLNSIDAHNDNNQMFLTNCRILKYLHNKKY